MSCSRIQTRKISVREFQSKYLVRQYLDNPMASDISITVVELVDDG